MAWNVQIPFVKYEGAGNDFVLVSEQDLDPSWDLSSLAIALCHRRKGVGADGLLVWGDSSVAAYRMRIWNADGSAPTMCGNGAYCLLDYLDRRVAPFQKISLETAHAILTARKSDDQLFLNLGRVAPLHFPLHLEEGLPCYVVHTGVPHAVIWASHLDQMDVDVQGSRWRYDPRFAPEGVNVNFAKIQPDGQVAIRTYERGVEGETLACGTGAAAVAFVAQELYALPNPIQIATRTDFSSSAIRYEPRLQFIVSPTSTSEQEVEMRGSARAVFDGVFSHYIGGFCSNL